MRIAVVSASLGDADPGLQDKHVPQVLPAGWSCDFHYFNEGNFPLRRCTMQPRLQVKIIRMCAWELLPDYDYYIWLDSTFTLERPDSVQWLVESLRGGDVALFAHPDRTTITAEGEFVLNLVKDGNPYLVERYREEPIRQQLAHYMALGHRDNQLWMTGVYVYRASPQLRAAFNAWLLECVKWSALCQVSFPFVVQQHRLAVATLDGNGLKSPYVAYHWDAAERRVRRPVTLVIPTASREGAERTTQLIASAETVARAPEHYFVINNGGFFTSDNPKVEVFTPGSNIGVGPAWNEALRRFPDWVIIANDDIELSHHSILSLVRAAETTGDDVGIIACTIGQGFPLFLHKKSTVSQLGYFDERFAPAYYEDTDYTYRARLAGVKVVQIETGVRHGPGGKTTVELGLDVHVLASESRRKYIAKWGGPPGEEKPSIYGVKVRPSPHLFVPSVPWRLPALIGLIECLGAQTVKIPVTFILDGYDDAGVLRVKEAATLASLDFTIKHHTKPRGAGARWFYMLELGDDALALSLDDDMVPGPTYIEQTLAVWTRLGEAFSWCGDGLQRGDYVWIDAGLGADLRLLNAGAGTACIPVALLRGIDLDPRAAHFFGRQGHDEALVSWFLAAKQRARIWRPAGQANLQHHALGHDPRAGWNASGKIYTPLMNELYARGWPVIDAPDARPLHVRREKFKQRVEEVAASQARKLAEARARQGKPPLPT